MFALSTIYVRYRVNIYTVNTHSQVRAMSVSTNVAHELNDADERILDELASGRNLPQNLANELGYSRQYVQNRLQMLKAADYVENVGGGLYELVDDPRDDVDREDDSDVEELRARIDELQVRIESATEWAEATVEALERVDGEDAEKNARATVAALEGDDE